MLACAAGYDAYRSLNLTRQTGETKVLLFPRLLSVSAHGGTEARRRSGRLLYGRDLRPSQAGQREPAAMQRGGTARASGFEVWLAGLRVGAAKGNGWVVTAGQVTSTASSVAVWDSRCTRTLPLGAARSWGFAMWVGGRLGTFFPARPPCVDTARRQGRFFSGCVAFTWRSGLRSRHSVRPGLQMCL